MSDRTVLKFPTLERASIAATSRQRDLFDQIDGGRAKIVFLDIEVLDEDRLLQMLAQNLIAALVDLRPRPVFRAPKFRHKQVVSYLYRHDIKYVESALIENALTDEKFEIGMQLVPMVAERLGAGITIFVYDEGTKEKGWLNNVRFYLNRDLEYWTELHPSVLTRGR